MSPVAAVFMLAIIWGSCAAVSIVAVIWTGSVWGILAMIPTYFFEVRSGCDHEQGARTT